MLHNGIGNSRCGEGRGDVGRAVEVGVVREGGDAGEGGGVEEAGAQQGPIEEASGGGRAAGDVHSPAGTQQVGSAGSTWAR